MCNCGKKAAEGVRKATEGSAALSTSIKTQVSAAQRVRDRQASRVAATTKKATSA